MKGNTAAISLAAMAVMLLVSSCISGSVETFAEIRNSSANAISISSEDHGETVTVLNEESGRLHHLRAPLSIQNLANGAKSSFNLELTTLLDRDDVKKVHEVFWNNDVLIFYFTLAEDGLLYYTPNGKMIEQPSGFPMHGTPIPR